jgi:cytochrome c-type biogenesis protein CcmH/NrfG
MKTMLEHDKEQAALEKIHADISRIYAEQRKLNAEAHKKTPENFWYPLGVVMAMFTVFTSVVALAVKILA